MSYDRSHVEHHPLVNQDQDDFDQGPRGSPETGYIMDTDMTGLSGPYHEPPDPSLSLLEVPNTNWTRPSSVDSNSSDGLNMMGGQRVRAIE